MIFSIDIWNENYFDVAYEPFTGSTQAFVYNKKTYNLKLNAERLLLAKDATVVWANILANGIKGVYPDLLLTASTFTPMAVNRSATDLTSLGSDSRHPLPLASLQNSALDYLDVHVYSSSNPSLAFDSAGLTNADSFSKPIVLGELGVYRTLFPQLSRAAASLTSLIQQACYRRAAGFLFWTWNTSGEQPENWDLTESRGALHALFSPENGPVCSHHAIVEQDKEDIEIDDEHTTDPTDDTDTAGSEFFHLHRLYNSSTRTHTTSPLQLWEGHTWDQTSFILSRNQSGVFDRALYLCRQRGSVLTFNSGDRNCEGHLLISLQGYLSSYQSQNATQAIHRCYKGALGHFTTHTVRECDDNGFRREGILGFAPAQ